MRALRPRLARIKVGRHLNIGIAGLGVRCRRCRLGQRAHERLDLAERHAAELYVLTGGPRGNIVDLLDCAQPSASAIAPEDRSSHTARKQVHGRPATPPIKNMRSQGPES